MDPRQKQMRKGRPRRWLLAPWVLGVFPAGLQAEEGKLAVSAKFANIGPGVDVTYGLSPQLHTRLTVHYAPTEELTHNDDIKAVGSWLLDWHPRGGAFRLSAGLSVVREGLGGFFSRDGRFASSYSCHPEERSDEGSASVSAVDVTKRRGQIPRVACPELDGRIEATEADPSRSLPREEHPPSSRVTRADPSLCSG